MNPVRFTIGLFATVVLMFFGGLDAIAQRTQSSPPNPLAALMLSLGPSTLWYQWRRHGN